ncbi:MAG TPA: 2-oxo acid dehydrogenase subunit E2 [Ignavibacteria bacterium]|nr:2-oxo acid dehydrogenase subunit E2 [Ignavibacteria bacterium]
MLKEIKLPEVSDNVENGDVIKILVAVGDKIKVDQPIIELETDKAMFEVPSSEEGTVKEINVKEGESIKIGSVILKIETNGAESKKDSKVETKGDVKKEADLISEKNTEVVVNKVEDKKVTGIENDPSQLMLRPEDPVPYNAGGISAPASPSVRRLARELGIEIDEVKGSGVGGRIDEEDVKKFVKSKMTSAESGVSVSNKSLPDFKKWGEVEIQPMSKIRAVTAASMSYAWSTIPMVTQNDKADITNLEEFRKKYSKEVEKSGGNLTITSILIKVCSAALNKFPQFNSSIDLNKKEIVYKKYFNIGIAVDTDRGLLVPVIKNTDKKSITEISVELNELAEKARNRKISLEEMDGGNFTISNLGGIGGTGFNPIVYSPQVAILGVSRGSKEAVYIDNVFEPRLMLPLSLTYDHRIIDGAEAARFLRWIAESLENPMKMNL